MINFTARFIVSLISVTRIMSFSDIIGFSDNRFLWIRVELYVLQCDWCMTMGMCVMFNDMWVMVLNEWMFYCLIVFVWAFKRGVFFNILRIAFIMKQSF